MPSIIESIVLKKSQPNFARDMVKTIQGLKEVSTRHYDEGHIVYCEENGVHYKFMPGLAKWDEQTGYFEQLVPDSVDTSQIEKQLDINTERLNKLYDLEFPIKASITAYDGEGNKTKNIYLIGSLIEITLKFNLIQDGKKVDIDNIEKITLIINDEKELDLFNFTEEYYIGTVMDDVNYKIEYHLTDGSVKTASTYIMFSPYSYFGLVDENCTTDDININTLKTFNSILLSSRLYTTVVDQDNQKNCFVYPVKYGALTSIKDDKNYELLGSYVKTIKTINDESYYVYLLEYASTVENYKLIFS